MTDLDLDSKSDLITSLNWCVWVSSRRGDPLTSEFLLADYYVWKIPSKFMSAKYPTSWYIRKRITLSLISTHDIDLVCAKKIIENRI